MSSNRIKSAHEKLKHLNELPKMSEIEKSKCDKADFDIDFVTCSCFEYGDKFYIPREDWCYECQGEDPRDIIYRDRCYKCKISITPNKNYKGEFCLCKRCMKKDYFK